MFDIYGRRRVVNSTDVRAINRPEEYEVFAEVSGEELSEALSKQKRRR